MNQANFPAGLSQGKVAEVPGFSFGTSFSSSASWLYMIVYSPPHTICHRLICPLGEEEISYWAFFLLANGGILVIHTYSFLHIMVIEYQLWIWHWTTFWGYKSLRGNLFLLQSARSPIGRWQSAIALKSDVCLGKPNRGFSPFPEREWRWNYFIDFKIWIGIL